LPDAARGIIDFLYVLLFDVKAICPLHKTEEAMLVYAYRPKDGPTSTCLWLEAPMEPTDAFYEYVMKRHGRVKILWTHPLSDPDRIRLIQGMVLLGTAAGTTFEDVKEPGENWMIGALEKMLTSAVRKQSNVLKTGG
jgi:hypothetical protein